MFSGKYELELLLCIEMNFVLQNVNILFAVFSTR